MNDKFDELAKGLAQSVTRRGALKKFGAGLAGMALAAFGLVNGAQAAPRNFHCRCNKSGFGCTTQDCLLACIDICQLKGGGGV
jgi:hypothetical protein